VSAERTITLHRHRHPHLHGRPCRRRPDRCDPSAVAS